MRILALIPARGGSKRLENKNRIPLLGKPLINYTIEEALKSSAITDLVVSTDDELLADLAKKAGASVPFIRPLELSGDEVGSFEVIEHCIEFLKSEGKTYDVLLMLQATSPLRIAKDIDNALDNLKDEGVKAVVSVCECEHSPLWMNRLPADRSMKDFLSKKELKHTRSQDLPEYYRLNGAVYAADIEYVLSNKGFFGANTKAYIMPRERSVDIDDKWDFIQAEAYLNERLKNED